MKYPALITTAYQFIVAQNINERRFTGLAGSGVQMIALMVGVIIIAGCNADKGYVSTIDRFVPGDSRVPPVQSDWGVTPPTDPHYSQQVSQNSAYTGQPQIAIYGLPSNASQQQTYGQASPSALASQPMTPSLNTSFNQAYAQTTDFTMPESQWRPMQSSAQIGSGGSGEINNINQWGDGAVRVASGSTDSSSGLLIPASSGRTIQ